MADDGCMGMQPTRAADAESGTAVAIRSLVVGEDGSVGSRATLEWAARHATGDIHVVRAVSPSFELLEAGFQVDGTGLVNRATEELDVAVHDLTEAAGRICPHVVEDTAPNALLDVAHRFEADAIVVGSNGHERFGNLVGANTGRLLHLSDLPVIVVPERGSAGGETSEERRHPTQIVVGASGDANADAQLVAWTGAVKSTASSITLLHALAPTPLAIIPTAEGTEPLKRQAFEYLHRLMTNGIEATASVMTDHPISALRDASQDAALLVVGSHRASRMSGFLTGSIVQHLPTVTACPIAIVPVTEQAETPDHRG